MGTTAAAAPLALTAPIMSAMMVMQYSGTSTYEFYSFQKSEKNRK